MTKCSKCNQPILATDAFMGHETATWHSVCPSQPNQYEDSGAKIYDNRFSRFDDELIDKFFNEAGKKAIDAYVTRKQNEARKDEVSRFDISSYDTRDKHEAYIQRRIKEIEEGKSA